MRRVNIRAAFAGEPSHGSEISAAEESAASSGRAHFVAGEGEEIAAEFLDIDRHVARALGGIDQSGDAQFARTGAKVIHGIDRAQRVPGVRSRRHGPVDRRTIGGSAGLGCR